MLIRQMQQYKVVYGKYCKAISLSCTFIHEQLDTKFIYFHFLTLSRRPSPPSRTYCAHYTHLFILTLAFLIATVPRKDSKRKIIYIIYNYTLYNVHYIHYLNNRLAFGTFCGCNAQNEQREGEKSIWIEMFLLRNFRLFVTSLLGESNQSITRQIRWQS